MPVNTTHAEYDAKLAAWTRARRVMAGEDAVKAAGEAFLPRLELQTDAECAAYKARASFFNATSRTADGFLGLVFRRAPFVRLPDVKTGVGLAFQRFENDVDLSGTNLGNTDFSAVDLGAQELMAAVHAWQAGALSRDSLMDLFRRGEILPAVRTNSEETKFDRGRVPETRW